MKTAQRFGLWCVAAVTASMVWPANAASGATFSISPTSISNTYTGQVTLQIGGLTNGETVRVEKYLDANTNGVIDAGDLLVQSFLLTDGQASVIGGVTNINVAFDSNPTNGAITAKLSFSGGGFEQKFIGQYLFRLSSPGGRWAAVTNSFAITNAPYAHGFTGTVKCGSTNIAFACVVVCPPHENPVAGALANSAGTYTVNVAPGTYQLIAFKSGYVENFNTAPMLTLSTNASITTNLNLLAATHSISGRYIDATTSNGIPGVNVQTYPMSTNNFLAIAFTDTNGNFSLPVTADQWQMDVEENGLWAYGYLYPQQSQPTVDTTSSNVSGVIVSLPKGTALFYGTVKDSQNHPLGGVQLWADDDNNQYEGGGMTDTNGNYSIAVLADGVGWYVSPGGSGSNPGFTNYVFSSGMDTNITAGQAVQVNFTGTIGATVSGRVLGGGVPLSGVNVQVGTITNYGGGNWDWLQTYYSNSTDTNGNYNVLVPPGSNYYAQVDLPNGSPWLQQFYSNTMDEASANMITALTNAPATNINFNLQMGATVSGRVLGNGSPLSGVNVQVGTITNYGGGNWDWLQTYYSNSTDTNGNYSVTVLPGSNYYAQVSLPNGSPWLQQMFSNTTDEASAMVIKALTNAPATNINFNLQEGITISGTITGGGNPLANVGVTVGTITTNQYGWNWQQTYYGDTDTNGYYSLTIPAGADYYVQFNPSGSWLGQFYGSSSDNPSSVPLSILTNTTLNFSLQPGAMVSGRVLGSGTPLSGVWVQVGTITNYGGGGWNWLQSYDSYQTDTNGNYSVTVPAGSNYYAQVSLPDGSPWLQQIFSNTTDIASATVITALTNAPATNINFNLQWGTTVSGCVLGNSTPLSGVEVQVGTVTNLGGGNWNWLQSYYSNNTDSNGNYSVTLPPGSNYYAQVNLPNGSPWMQQLYNNDNAMDIDSATMIVTSTNTPATGINFNLQQGAVITVNVSTNGGGTVSGGGTFAVGSTNWISATPFDGWSFIGWSDSNTDNPRAIVVPADGATYMANFTYTISLPFNYTTNGDNTITITGYTTYGGALTIPSTINGLMVTSIGDHAFYACGLSSVTIPASINAIGSMAFAQNALTMITVDPSNTVYSSVNGVLFNKSQTTLIQYPGGLFGSYTIPSGVASIGAYAFYYDTGLTGVTIPASVTNIGDEAFMFCSGLSGVYCLGILPGIGSEVFFVDPMGDYDPATVYYLAANAASWSTTFGGLPTALWQKVNVTVTASPAQGGLVTGGGTYWTGTNVQITATASNGWLFTNWNDGTTINSYSIIVPPTNITYTANFVPAATITVNLSTNVGGYVIGGGTYAVGSTNWIVGVPSNGWVFTMWSDGNTQEVRPIIVSSNITYTADFTPGSAVTPLPFTLLHSFTGDINDGAYPGASLTISGSSLYGTASGGGAASNGVVFRVNTTGVGYTNLHNFVGGVYDGMQPVGSLTLAGSIFYGTATEGGVSNAGVIFRMNLDGTGYTNVYAFVHTGTDSPGVDWPCGDLTLSGSTLYGEGGSSGGYDFGGIYSVNIDGSGFTVLPPNLYFSGGSPVLAGSTLYGYDYDGIYAVNTNGTGYTNLHSFSSGYGANTDNPAGSPTLAGSTLYGTTSGGSVLSNGVIFSMNTNGTGYTILHTFLGGSADGANPNTTLTLAGSKLYGMTTAGGASDDGVIFSMNTNGTGYTILHTFAGGTGDGAEPSEALILSGFMLYGVTYSGGVSNMGTVFALSLMTTTTVNVAASPINSGSVRGGGNYLVGTNIQLSAVASNGWLFTSWNDGTTTNPYTIMVPPTNITYTANFARASTVTALASPTNAGSVTGAGLYFVGSNAVLAAIASNNWLFTKWNDGTTTNPYSITVPSTNITYTAIFATAATITVSDNTNVGGTVTGSGIYLVGSTNQITAAPSNGWTFLRWNDGTTSNPRTIVVSSNITYTATFAPTALITVQPNPANGGTVTGSGTYVVGSNATISAIASNLWQFTGWNDTGSNNTPRTVVVPSGGATYTANFAPLGTVSTLVIPTNAGGVTGGGQYIVGSNATVTATASNNWLFLNWNGSITNNPWVFGVTNGTMVCTATFARVSTVTALASPTNAGSVTGAGLYFTGSNAVLTAIASNNWLFTKWNDGTTTNPYSITVPPTNITYTAIFAAAATITVSDNTNVGGTVTGSGIYLVGSTNQITAAPSNGWAFIGWNDGTTNNPRTIVVSSNITYTAIFAPTALITVQGNPANGGTVTGSGTYVVGSNATISAIASNLWQFTGWNDTGSNNTPRTVVVPSGGATYTANFAPLGTVSTLVIPTNAGSVTGGGLYLVGSNATVTATASNSWLFLNWNGSITNNPWVFSVTNGTMVCTANFARLSTVTALASPTNAGGVIGGGTYLSSTNIYLTAIASNNWLFTKWNDGTTTNPYSITVPPTNITYTAIFAATATITVGDNTNVGGTVTGSGIYLVGSTNQITAAPSNGWAFIGWNDGTTNNPRTIVVSSNITYTATFAPTALITVQANPANGGTVTGSGTYVVGSNAIISATASNLWRFTGWNDTGSNNTPRTVLVPSGGATYTANFAPLGQVTALANPTNAGSVTGGGLYLVGSNATVTATASNSWLFLNWNGNATNNPWTFMVVSNGMICTANFARISTVTGLASPTNGGNVTGGGTYLSSSNISLTANPYNSWLFTGWKDSVTNNPRSVVVPPTNITYTAMFVQTAGVAVAVNTNIGGSVTGSGVYDVGSNAVLTATASNGWIFTRWNDSNISNPRTIVVTAGGASYTASFAPAATLTLLANPTNSGSVSGAGLYAIGGTAPISAAANLSWRFTSWSDGNPTNARAYLVVSNTTLTANFTNAAHIYMQDQVGNITKWAINNTNTLQQYATFGGMGAWILKAAGDMNLDCKADLFWQQTNGPNGCAVAYLSQTNSSYLGIGLGNMGAWTLCAAADLDGDGIADLIWQHSAGWVSIWCMNSNCTQRSGASLGNMGVWKLKGAGDINGDGKADLIWQSPMGDVVVWLSQPGGGYQGLGVGNLGAWELRAVHDVDGDGIADLLWQNPGGWTVVWYMNSNGTVRAGVGLGNIFVGTTTNKIMAVE